jgi:hypothetical protein
MNRLNLDISDEEKLLGFEVILIQDPSWNMVHAPAVVPVVAKILNSSDVVLKIMLFGQPAFSHRRFGWMREAKMLNLPPEWNPVGNPYPDAQIAVFEASIHASETDGPEVISCDFTFEKG